MDKKPLSEWYQHVPGVENLCLDLSDEENCQRVCEGAVEVYNLAADMGGMGFIERFRVECLRSVLINTHMIEAAYRAGARRYFYSSSACAYNTALQKDPNVRALKESDAYPAMAERGYGWEKLISEMFCQEYWAERGMKTAIARFHNVYGPHGTWDGGREKAPAAHLPQGHRGQGHRQARTSRSGATAPRPAASCTSTTACKGIDMIMHCDELIATPINLGSSELVSINELVSKVEKIAGVKLKREYDLDAPQGVAGRNSDNTFIKKMLKWEPDTTLEQGAGGNLQVDQRAIPRPQGRQTRGHRLKFRRTTCPGRPGFRRRAAGLTADKIQSTMKTKLHLSALFIRRIRRHRTCKRRRISNSICPSRPARLPARWIR